MRMRRFALAALVAAGTAVTAARQASAPETPAADPGWTMASFPAQDWPTGTVPEAEALVTQAKDALNHRIDVPTAVALLGRALTLDPKHPYAWWRLGSLQIGMGEVDAGITNMRRQTEVAPSPAAFKNAAFILHMSHMDQQAIAFWRDGVAKYPDDREMSALFGETLLSAGQFAEAADVLQAQTARYPNSSRLHLNLARALVGADRPDEAVAHFERAAALEPGDPMWSAVADALAGLNRDLDTALSLARQSVDAVDTRSAAWSLPDAGDTISFPAQIGRMTQAWVVMATVLTRRGALDEAQPYAVAAFEGGQYVRGAMVLGALADARQDAAAAADAYAAAMASSRLPNVDAAARLTALVPDATDREQVMNRARTRVSALTSRAVTRPAVESGALSVEFAAVTGADGVVVDVMATPRSRDNPGAALLIAQLKGLRIGPVVPWDSQITFVRDGQIRCAVGSAACTASLYSLPAPLVGN